MAREIKVKVKRLTKSAVIPYKTHERDACYDVVAIGVNYDKENDSYIYNTGLAFQTDTFSVMRCWPRSSNSKTEFYLTNSVGTVDTCTYTGEVKAIFKHRDGLKTRVLKNAMEIYDDLPWYQKLRKGTLKRIIDSLYKEFYHNPIKWAPYHIGDRIMQVDFEDVHPVNFKSVAKLKDTSRGANGFGSTNEQTPENDKA